MLTSRIAHLKIVILVLCFFIASQLAVIFGLIYTVQAANDEISINVRPPLPNQKQVYGKADVPPPTAWGFAVLTWPIAKRCPVDCAIDEVKNLKLTSYYAMISQPFYQDLLADNKKLKAKRQLQNRTREFHLLQDVFKSSYAKQYEDGWEVYVDFQIKEYANGVLIKDRPIRYFFYVKSSVTDQDKNQWGLTLEGMTRSPQKIIQTEAG